MNAIARLRGFFGKSYGTPVRFPLAFGGSIFGTNSGTSREVINATTVARCIGAIADGIASCPLVVERRVGRGKWEILDADDPSFHGIARIFERPNRDQGGAELATLHHAAKQTFGRAYLLLDYLNAGAPVSPGRAFPRELRYLRPDNVEPLYDSNPRIVSPIGYRYTPEGGVPVVLRPDEVCPDRLPSALNPLSGQSPAATAAWWALIESVLGWYHHGYFRNGARAGLVFETDQKLNKQALGEMRESWNEQFANAVGKAFSTVFLHSGMKLKEQQAGRKEGDFLDLFRVSKEQIYTAWGVPPALAGDFSHATLANIEEQTPIFMEGTLAPRARVSEQQYNLHIVPRFDPTEKVRFRYAWELTPAMKRRSLERAKTLVVLAGVPVLTPDEARAMENFPPLPDGVGATLFVPFSMTPASVLFEPPAPAPAPPAPGKPAQEPQDDAEPEDDAEDEDAPEKGAGGKGTRQAKKWIDDPARNAKRAAAARGMGRFIPGAEREMVRFLNGQEARVLAAVRANDPGKAAKVVGEDVFDETFEAEANREVLVRIYSQVVGTRGPEAFDSVAGSGAFNMDHAEVVEYLKRHAYENGTFITGTTADRVAEAVREYVEAGQTIQDLTNRIGEIYDLRRHEAQRIARTEVASSYNFATQAAWKQSGVVEKVEWLTSQDDAVRDSHMALDGEVVNLGEKFSNGLEFPGDPSASDASEVVNCRCALLPVTKSPSDDDEERAFRAADDLLALLAKDVDRASTVALGTSPR